MKMRWTIWGLIGCLAILINTASMNGADSHADQLVTYPAPNGAVLNSDFSVRVRNPGHDWQNLADYLLKIQAVKDNWRATLDTSMAYFDFSGTVDVSITYNKRNIDSARVRPLSYGITPQVKGNIITFSLSQPRNLSVEVNGDVFHNLQLFANSLEANPPDPKDSNVIYYGPGIHQVGRLSVPSGKTVYIAGGAVVQGQILIDGVENARVMGRGMLDQSTGGVRIANSKNVEVNGIFSNQVFTGGSQHVAIRNVKCMSFAGNGDGMNVICSTDVVIDGVFNRNSDDCVTVYGRRRGFIGDARNITVENSTLWADVAHPILVGTHGDTANPDTLEDLKFINLDILDHNEKQIDYQGCMSLDAGDHNIIRKVRFDNIRVEDFREGQLVSLRVFFNKKYNTSPGGGIDDVYFKDITYNGTHANTSIIAGYDDTRMIKNVVFENLKINGLVISDGMAKPAWYRTSDMANFFVGEHVDGLQFIEAGQKPKAEQ
jgi:hypothetical protein